MPRQPTSYTGDALKAAAAALYEELREKVVTRQGRVANFFDHFLVDTIHELQKLDPQAPWESSVAQLPGPLGKRLRSALPRLQRALAGWNQDRFADYYDRQPALPLAEPWLSDIEPATLAMSQGTRESLHWRGMPLFKTAFDLGIYQMLLWELRPATVIEIGSGSGAGAAWLADMLKMFGLETPVYSLDLSPPSLRHDGVRFLQGDCRDIARALPAALLADMPHPWLTIEDAHVAVEDVLRHLHGFLQSGDYLVVEDSAGKRKEIDRFLNSIPDAYRVDTRFTDFFGRNATCAFDSIFVRV